MANRSHVPQFGKWDSEDNVPYTVFFDKARKGRPGQMVNPNDPEDNRSVISDNPDSREAPPYSRSKNEPSVPVRQGPVRPVHDRMTSREDAGLRQFPDPTTRETMHRPLGDRDRRSQRSEHSVERSPLPRQARGRESPAWEGNQSYDSNQGAPTKTRMNTANNSRSHDNLDKAAAVPVFGSWNNDPASAEGYTHIFKKVREDRHSEPVNEAEMPSRRPEVVAHSNIPIQKKVCCFPWI